MKNYKLHIILFFLLTGYFSFSQTYEVTNDLYNQAELVVQEGDFVKAAQLYEAAALNELQLEAPRIEDSYQILSIASYLFFKTEHFERALDNRVTKSFQISWSKLSAYEFVESSR